jgi:hypothetical protein
MTSIITKLAQETDKGQLRDGQPQICSHPLVLVGTVHRDPRGYARLFRVLEKERPGLITVEMSSYSRTFRVRQSSMIRDTLRANLRKIQKEDRQPLSGILSHSLILGIFFLLKEPFEWRAAKSYASQYGVLLQEIDLSSFAQDHLAYLSELVALKNLRTLLHLNSLAYGDLVQAQYSRADFLFHHPPLIRLTPPAFQEREVFMAGKIRELIQGTTNKGKILHVAGWEHLIDSPEENSLVGLLKDLQPRRVLLSTLGN